MAEKKELTKEEELELLEKLRQGGIGVTGVSAIAGLTGLGIDHLNKRGDVISTDSEKYLGKRIEKYISDRAKTLKVAGAVGIPVGAGLVAYSSYKKKKLKNDSSEK